MRIALLVACLLSTALAGCVDPLGEQLVADPAAGEREDDAPPHANDDVEAAPAPTTGGAPLIASIATSRFTAPEPVELASVAEGGIGAKLVADLHGISCVPTIDVDVMAAPPGYRVDRTWIRCALAADNETFTQVRQPSLDAPMPLMLDVPVDHFVWSLQVGRVLVNNSGEHPQVLLQHNESLLAAPMVSAWVADTSFASYVCDTSWDSPDAPEGVETITWMAEAQRGRPSIHLDTSRINVLDFTSQIGNVSIEDGIISAVGAWGDDTIDLSVTIDFEADENYLRTSTKCGGASSGHDSTYLLAWADAEGIAAGWHAYTDADARVNVYVVWL